MLGETYCLAFCWYSRAFLVSAEALVVYSTALSTWASILIESCLKLLWPQQVFRKLLWPQKVICDVKRIFYLFTISPWFSTKTAMSMNISCNSLIDDSSFTNISCLEKCNDKFLPEETGLNFDHISLGRMGFKNWSLNADFSVWLEENQNKTKDHSQGSSACSFNNKHLCSISLIVARNCSSLPSICMWPVSRAPPPP